MAVDIHYTPGAKYNVKVQAKREVLDKINISENGSVLMLKRKKVRAMPIQMSCARW